MITTVNSFRFSFYSSSSTSTAFSGGLRFPFVLHIMQQRVEKKTHKNRNRKTIGRSMQDPRLPQQPVFTAHVGELYKINKKFNHSNDRFVLKNWEIRSVGVNTTYRIDERTKKNIKMTCMHKRSLFLFRSTFEVARMRGANTSKFKTVEKKYKTKTTDLYGKFSCVYVNVCGRS